VSLPQRPTTILIAALGGEGGGVMADWLVDAATRSGFPVQSTSIPGVAQRTGATTYYLEIYPAPRDALGGREPVMSLTPTPGNVDVMVASELLEAARAMQSGYVSPERTTFVASTHRVYATVEKMQMGDGRFDGERALESARQLAKRPVLFDMRELALANGTVINAVLFGAMAGSGALPLSRDACEAAIRAGGRGAEASLRGFAAGFGIAAGAPVGGAATAGERRATARQPGRSPLDAQQVIALGVERLKEYQGDAYADLFVQRVNSLGTNDAALLAETARQLAVWMSYDDIIRVADLKTRATRFERVRREAGAKVDEPVVVVDYLKPGVEEVASLLPPFAGRRLVAWAQRRGKLDAYNVGMHLKTSGVAGYLVMRGLALLRRWRPYSHRYAEEQQLIERWLGHVREAATRSVPLALEIARCARLLKGYGDTHRRGRASFVGILDALVEHPPVADASAQAAAIRAACAAALADPEGDALSQQLGRKVIWLNPGGATAAGATRSRA
jgi:indolepyruvate ferredoxin oxidoreductase beta subunit